MTPTDTLRLEMLQGRLQANQSATSKWRLRLHRSQQDVLDYQQELVNCQRESTQILDHIKAIMEKTYAIQH